MTRRLVPLAAMVTLLTTAPALSAQSASPAGPRLDEARAGITLVPQATADAIPSPSPLLQPAAMRKRGVPQMVIGGVAIVGGMIIGDDVGTVVSLAGLGYGLYGLYLYLN